MNHSIIFDPVEAGRRLGHDLYRYGRTVEDDIARSVCEGYVEALRRHLPRQPADRYVRKWLQLRISAQRRGRVVSDDVRPELLRRIDVPECPVRRVALTYAERSASDWSVDRLNNDGAYAANNLAVMSTSANRAKGSRSYDEVYRLSQSDHASHGLEPVEWLRLAALMLGPCHTAHPAEAPIIPLNVPVTTYTARPIVQQLQHVFTQRARLQSGKNLLIKSFRPACPTDRSLRRLQVLAEAVHQGVKAVETSCDAWLDPRVLDAFVDWRTTLDWRAWALAGEISRVLAGATQLPSARICSWHLSTRGYVC